MMRKILVLSCLFASLNVQAQHADARISQLMNESRWFDLAQELKTTPADSVTPWVRQMGVAMTHYFFNRPDSACMVLTDLLGDHTLNMVVLLAVNLGRTEQYADAAGLIRNLCDQLGALGMDSTQTAPYRMMARQYGILASCGPVCQPLHKAGEYRFPMVTEHETDQHFIEMDGSINGQAGRMVLNTGAGSNMVTPEQAEKYGLRRLGMDVTVGGVSITRSYILPQKKFRIGSGTAVLDSVGVNTGIDLHTGQLDKAAFSNGQEDGFLGLNLLEKFSKVIINLKDMYLETIPYTDK